MTDEPDIPGAILVKQPTTRRAPTEHRLSRVHRRLIEPVATDKDTEPGLSFLHTVFCQAGLPYRNPGDAVRLWQRQQGIALLEVQAGRVANPAKRSLQEVGLPWGTKPRLILAHLNAEALRQASPVVEVEGSLSAFVQRVRGFNGGREIRSFKEQLTRLAAATIRLALFHSDHEAEQIETRVITQFDLWLEKDERQRVFWPTTVRLSLDYFASLLEHAVPLREADLAALAHSATALDVYAWLAQRLHRISPRKPVFIPWEGMRQQFPADYERIRDFRHFFQRILDQVLARYQTARVEVDEQGVTLRNSLPPVSKRLVMLPRSGP